MGGGRGEGKAWAKGEGDAEEHADEGAKFQATRAGPCSTAGGAGLGRNALTGCGKIARSFEAFLS